MEPTDPTPAAAEIVHKTHWATKLLVIITLASNLAFSGLIFGWGPIKLLLSQDGVYRDLCPPDANSPPDRAHHISGGGGGGGSPHELSPHSSSSCLARESAFARIYSTAGVIAQLSGIACGTISDRFGPQATIALGGSLVSGCLLALGWMDPPAPQAYLLVLVYGVLTFGCFLFLFSSFSSAFIWREHQGTIITCCNVFFDASASTSLALYQLYDQLGLSREALFTAFAALAATASLLQILLWIPNNSILHAAKAQSDPTPQPTQDSMTEPLLNSDAGGGEDEEGGRMDGVMVVVEGDISGGGLWQQLRSRSFAFLAGWGALQVFRSVVFLGVFSSLLAQYGDEDRDYRYTKLFSATLPACVLFIPLVSWTLRHCSWSTTFQIINAVGIAWNVLALVPWLPLQALTGFIYVGFRAYLFSCLFGFCATTFGARTAGRVYGFANLIASAVVTLQFLATGLTYEYASGDFRYLYAAMAALAVPLIPITHYAMRNNF